MRIPKSYGNYKIERCPFCGQQGTTRNSQGLVVCTKHKNAKLGEMRCVCGEYLELKSGKYGAYFKCLRCGNVNLKRVFQTNKVVDVNAPETMKTDKPAKEITIRSDDARYF